MYRGQYNPEPPGFSSSHSLVSDFHVLLALKQGFEFSDSPALSTWTASNFSSVCSWVGIQCSDGRVVSVNLTDLSLGGYVSPLISSLDQLTELSVAGNNFSGGIEVVNLKYAYTLRVDEKSDVYSFGVVLLELLTGRRPIGDFGDGVVDIAQWCKKALKDGENENDILCIVDKRVGMVPKEEAKHLFFIAMLCVQENSVERPTMREVVQMLAEFPHQSPNCYQSSSSSSPCQKLKNGEKERKY
ncbi:unnamed protein product [Citrullus colocynthis]|uniref:Protein kinase domain-containing protein n=1 Tax=Citrullus colocynthis TaxID=252529 RepID=A0ABP0YPT8_9ROSI